MVFGKSPAELNVKVGNELGELIDDGLEVLGDKGDICGLVEESPDIRFVVQEAWSRTDIALGWSQSS